MLSTIVHLCRNISHKQQENVKLIKQRGIKFISVNIGDPYHYHDNANKSTKHILIAHDTLQSTKGFGRKIRK